VRLRLDRNSGVWRAIGICDGRVATIVLPPSVKGESADRWVERIDQAFEQAASATPGLAAPDSDGH
jgi:hypothetical protein